MSRRCPPEDKERFLKCPVRFDTALFLATADPKALKWMKIPGFFWPSSTLNPPEEVEGDDFSFLTELGFEGKDLDDCVLYFKTAVKWKEVEGEEEKGDLTEICLFIKTPATTIPYYVWTCDGLESLKWLIARDVGIHINRQRLLFRGEEVLDVEDLGNYPFGHGSTLHLQEASGTPADVKEAFASLSDTYMYDEYKWVRDNWEEATIEVSNDDYDPEDVPLENLVPCLYRDFRVLEDFLSPHAVEYEAPEGDAPPPPPPPPPTAPPPPSSDDLQIYAFWNGTPCPMVLTSSSFLEEFEQLAKKLEEELIKRGGANEFLPYLKGNMDRLEEKLSKSADKQGLPAVDALSEDEQNMWWLDLLTLRKYGVVKDNNEFGLLKVVKKKM